MPKQRPRRASAQAKQKTAQVEVETPEPSPHPSNDRATLAVLVYLCGDNHIQAETDKYLEQLLCSAPCENIHLVIQYDTVEGAKRYIIKAGETRTKKTLEEPVRTDVNTGDPAALDEFLAWGLRAVSAEHHVLIFSGLGINPCYVRQSLPLEGLPESLRLARGGKPGKPDDNRAEFASTLKAVSSKDPSVRSAYREAIHERTFSICHDFSNSGSLEISELREVLINATQYFDEVKRDDRFDLILFHVGAAGFVEVLFELDGLARVFIGSSQRLPDAGLPFSNILRGWNGLSSKQGERKLNSTPYAHVLAENFLHTLEEFKDDPSYKDYGKGAFDTLVAVNLDTLEEVSRVLDALTVALLHSLGDWHVIDAICQAIQQVDTASVKTAEIVSSATKPAQHQPDELDEIEFIPSVGLFEFLDAIEQTFWKKLEGGEVPAAFGQRERIQKLYKLIRKSVAHLRSQRLLRDARNSGSLFLGNDGAPTPNGLCILLPPLRSREQIANETGEIYSLATPSYSRLNFSRRVHWSSLIGTVQMIHEKPHALWRIISSMLVDANSTARDAALSRFISKDSVVSQLRGQFRSLGDSESLTMSFDTTSSINNKSDLIHFQVRLEPSLGGGIVYQHDSRVYKSSLDSSWRNLHAMLNASEPMEDLARRLRSLGAALGEDVVQDLTKPLELERDGILSRGGEMPHLTLQMPREFMRFPWELMNDGQGMLCERYALGRQVYMDTSLIRPPLRRSSDVIRVLVIGDPEYTPEFIQDMLAKNWRVSRLPSAKIEAEIIANSFEHLNDEMAGVVQCHVTSRIGQKVTVNDVRQFLRDGGFDLIHYAGHAMFDSTDGDGSAWALSDGLLHAREIRNTLARCEQPPWLIFANACEAGMDGVSGNPTAPMLDVTGLATACINFGVAAYIAPLWQVDDEIARSLAVRFYRELVRDRYSIGESLRRARCFVWDQLQESGGALKMPARTALTWSSFVLYGDPTSRLLQTLWTPIRQRDKKATGPIASTRSRSSISRSSRFRSVMSGQLSTSIDLPSKLLLSDPVAPTHDTTGAAENISRTKQEPSVHIELVERIGLRFWRTTAKDSTTGSRTYSPLGRILDERNDSAKAERIRQAISSRIAHERGALDEVKVIKSWTVKKYNRSVGKSLVVELAADFDRELVCDEQLYRIVSTTERRRIVDAKESRKRPIIGDDEGDWLRLKPCHGQVNRAVLLIHGAFSNCSNLLSDFAKLVPANRYSPDDETESLLTWMLRSYRAVLGFDHWTLSKDPQQNAEMLLSQLPKHWRSEKSREGAVEIDIVCHGRGGLVARELIQALKAVQHGVKIGRVIMVGVPNGGTSLAEPDNWGMMADMLVNQLIQDSTGLLGRLSSFLFYLTAQGIEEKVPGLNAMRPFSKEGAKKTDPDTYLAKLAKSEDGVDPRFYVVASNYVPDRSTLSLRSILSEIDDSTLNHFLSVPNDLIVDTASMWSFDKAMGWEEAVTAIDPKKNVLLFNTSREGPPEIVPKLQSGVHHFNYFANRQVREFIRETLDYGQTP